MHQQVIFAGAGHCAFGQRHQVALPLVRGEDHFRHDGDTAGKLTLEFLSLSRPFSLPGLTSLSIPAGRDDNGLPIGMQLVGQPGEDARLVTLAGHLQR